MNTKNTAKITAWSLFIIYAAVMLYLLLVQRLFEVREPVTDYIAALSSRLIIVPFSSITVFLQSVQAVSLSDYAFRNLAGNIILFVPIGIFLPVLFVKQRKFGIFLLTTVIIISAVEITQLVTLLGTCDVDDLLLNTAGACIGYWLWRLYLRIRTRRSEHTER